MSDPTDIPEWTLGWRLQRSLAHGGVSIDDMAAELGVSRQSISRWLNARAVPRIGYLKLWALKTGVPLDWLISGESDFRHGGAGGIVARGLMFDKRSPALGAAA